MGRPGARDALHRNRKSGRSRCVKYSLLIKTIPDKLSPFNTNSTGMANKTVQRIMDEVPRGHPIDSGMLRDMGISAALASSLEKSGWLQRLSQGVYLLRGDVPSAEGIIAFLSRRIPGLHVGGKSALLWHQGFGSRIGEGMVTLWGSKSSAIPPWVGQHMPFHFQTTNLFNGDIDVEEGLAPASRRDSSVLMSGPERALLELASDIGKTLSVEEARQLVQGVRLQGPAALERLAVCCTRVKVIRLVRVLCTHAGIVWSERLKAHADLLGAGKRWSNRTRTGKRLTLHA